MNGKSYRQIRARKNEMRPKHTDNMGKLFPAFLSKKPDTFCFPACLPVRMAIGQAGGSQAGLHQTPPDGGAKVPSRVLGTAGCLRRVTQPPHIAGPSDCLKTFPVC